MDDAARAGRGYLTATDLGRYHVHLCKKLLWLANDQRRVKGPRVQKDVNVLDQARFDKGNKWEIRLQERLDEEGLIMRGPGERHITIAELMNRIQTDPRAHYYFVDLSFIAPAFTEQLAARGWPAGSVAFGTFKPDFLEMWIERGPPGPSDSVGPISSLRWRVIDAKASKRVKISHQVQVGFYWICLASLFETWAAHHPVISANIDIIPDPLGIVWIPSADVDLATANVPATVGEFSLPMFRPLLENFLFDELPKTLASDVAEVPWHLNPLCRGCDFVARCENETVAQKRLGNIPDLAMADHAFLRDVRLSCGGSQIRDLEDLHYFLHDSEVQDRLPTGARARVARLLNTGNGNLLGSTSQGVSSCPISESSVVRAAVKQTVVPHLRRYLRFPRTQDVAVYLALGLDPETDQLFAFTMRAVECSTRTVIYEDKRILSSDNAGESGRHFVESLAALIRDLVGRKQSAIDLNPKATLRVQFYVASQSDHAALTRVLIIQATSEGECPEATKLCIGALLDDAGILLTSVQPELISPRVLVKLRSTANVPEIKRYLQIFGGSSVSLDGTKPVLLERLAGIMQAPARGVVKGLQRMVPKVTVLRDCVSNMFALPIPGFFSIEDCHAHLVQGGLRIEGPLHQPDMWAAMYALQKEDPQHPEIDRLLAKVSEVMEAVELSARRVMEKECKDAEKSVASLLPNTARDFEVLFIDVCKDPALKRLLFMAQFEVVTQLENLVQSRLANTHSTRLTLTSTDGATIFTPVSGSENLDNTPAPTSPGTGSQGPGMYQYIITRADDDQDALLSFDDLEWSGVFVVGRPGITGGPGWGVAEVIGWDESGDVEIKVRCQRGFLVKNTDYLLSKRMVDFNTTKLIKNILTIDDELHQSPTTPPFVTQLLHESPTIDAPLLVAQDQAAERRLQAFYREYYELQGEDKANIELCAGKTHTLALSALRLMELAGRRSPPQPFRILVVSTTNNAVELLLAKFGALLNHARGIENMARGEWRDSALPYLLPKVAAEMPKPDTLPSYAIVGATCWGVFNWAAQRAGVGSCFDALIIDEASQMTVTEALIPIHCVFGCGDTKDKRLVVAGDHMQLAPVLQGVYPLSPLALFGSVLEWLVDVGNDALPPGETTTVHPRMDMLTENFRMVRDLCAFSNTLYKKGGVFIPMRSGESDSVQAFVPTTTSLALSIPPSIHRDMVNFGTLPVATRSVIFVPGEHIDFEAQLKVEAQAAVKVLRVLAERGHDLKAPRTVMVVTPHRAQRVAVRRAVEADEVLRVDAGNIRIDTVERIQGGEADVVVVCYAFTGCAS
ncbi:hypothetical protein HKX48_004236 [Thoreauomyces humboldtii]|nr:hypothetical protein HKX48_004236 [Thoreauomyces humboldtii]